MKENLLRYALSFVSLAVFTFLTAGFASAQTAAAPAQAAPPPPTPQQTVSSATAATPQSSAAMPSQADAATRTKAIVQHLNSVLRFYHDAGAPAIQTVGEPSDLIYRDQVLTFASQIASYAFQSAKAEAALLANVPPAADPEQPGQTQTQAQKLQNFRDTVTQRIAQLKTQDADLQAKLATARPREVAALQEQRQQTQGELELQKAMQDALEKITQVSGITKDTGFLAQIEKLERSAPGLTTGKSTTVPPTLESLSAARSAGVSSQARVLFDLLGTRQSIESLIKETNALHQQAVDLHAPLVSRLRSTIAEGEALSQQASAAEVPTVPGATSLPTPSTSATLADTRKKFDSLTTTFKQISGASIPLSQEVMALEQSQASLNAWKGAVDVEYTTILHSLLLRVLGIAIALGTIFILGEVWRRATTSYVKDIRRRRQLLVVRRLVIGFLSGLVMIFGLVTQFSSLATFAGFITAGLAVGLQTILLSVAAYFFIIGRYGVKVGDRITVAGVTGDVAEVGLVRFYVLELAGSGTDLYPSGRVAVFSNAVLFQAGTPLYKQLPGTEYLWHEMTVKLNQESDYRPATEAMLQSIQKVYDRYRQQIEQQHRQLESWMDTSLDLPGIQSSLQLVDGGLQFWVRFPVLIRQTTETDNRMTEALLATIASDAKVKAAVNSAPIVKAAVKG